MDIMPVSTLNVPPAQLVHTLFPNPVSNVPDGQFMQDVLNSAPKVVEYLPCRHDVHCVQFVAPIRTE